MKGDLVGQLGDTAISNRFIIQYTILINKHHGVMLTSQLPARSGLGQIRVWDISIAWVGNSFLPASCDVLHKERMTPSVDSRFNLLVISCCGGCDSQARSTSRHIDWVTAQRYSCTNIRQASESVHRLRSAAVASWTLKVRGRGRYC